MEEDEAMLIDAEEGHIIDEKEEEEEKEDGMMTDELNQKEMRVVPIPVHRITPLKNAWIEIVTPIVQQMQLQVRYNTRKKQVEIKTSEHTKEIGALQKAADFVHAFALGFSVADSMALLRLDDIYIDSFMVDDVKMLHGDHLGRAIGRIAGKDGKTKFAIENATRTRIVLADRHVHIMGSYNNIQPAKDAICSLILGTPPGKVYAKLRTVAGRVNERF